MALALVGPPAWVDLRCQTGTFRFELAQPRVAAPLPQRFSLYDDDEVRDNVETEAQNASENVCFTLRASLNEELLKEKFET